MTDIVARLRWPPIHGSKDHPVSVALRIEAADEIERLRKAAQSLIDEIRERGTHECWKGLANVISTLTSPQSETP